MKSKLAKYLIVMLLSAASQLCSAQYFQRLFDNDSSYDWGWCILNKPDNNFFVLGWSYHSNVDAYSTFNMTISNDGNTILARNEFKIDTGTLGPGLPGEIGQVANGNFIAPLTIQLPNPVTHYLYSAGGLMKLGNLGNNIFFKTYTDTSVNFDIMNACALVHDGGYLIGGGRSHNTLSYYEPLILIRTDSSGDTLWTRTYQKSDTQSATVNSLIPLADGRIVVGAMTTYLDNYYHNVPWFIVLDSLGNITKDTLYGTQYAGGGTLYNDISGGYIHVGEFNYVFTPDPSDIENFPGYIAHLDTNFRFTWVTTFNYSTLYGHRDREVMRQLRDSSYLVVGDAQTHFRPFSLGWAAKLSKTGTILWNKTYFSDSAHPAYFRDAIEEPDGRIVFVGKTFNDTCAYWKDNGDMWLVSVDSDGNLPPDYTGVQVIPTLTEGEIKAYPNPSKGSFKLWAADGGKFVVYSLLGQQVRQYTIKSGETDIQLPQGIASGIYVGKFTPDNGGDVTEIRLVYQQ